MALAAVATQVVQVYVQTHAAVADQKDVEDLREEVPNRAAEDSSLAPPLRIARRHEPTPIAVESHRTDASHPGPFLSLSRGVVRHVHFFHAGRGSVSTYRIRQRPCLVLCRFTAAGQSGIASPWGGGF